MQAEAIDTRQLMRDYFKALSSEPKTEALIDQYVSDPSLKAHILQTDAGFPGYSIEIHALIGEGDLIAVRGTVHGTHKGEYAGIAPTGKEVHVSAMMFYQVTDGRISNFWMQVDMQSLFDQLKS